MGPMTGGKGKVWGCLECGAFVEELSAEGWCPVCKVGLVVELGGAPTADKAQALIAWARRDATEVIQNRGTIIGAVSGFLLGILLSLFATELGAVVIVLFLYTGVLGALIGRLSALRLHRRLRPHHHLQPVPDEAAHRRLVIALTAWVILPGVLLAVFTVFGGTGKLELDGRRLLGSLWALLAGD